MSSSERVERFRKRQERAGRKLVSLYLDADIADVLSDLSKPMTRGEIVGEALRPLLIPGGTQADKRR
jgi:hypothetical protein